MTFELPAEDMSLYIMLGELRNSVNEDNKRRFIIAYQKIEDSICRLPKMDKSRHVANLIMTAGLSYFNPAFKENMRFRDESKIALNRFYASINPN